MSARRSSPCPSIAGLVLALLLATALQLAAQSTPVYPAWWTNQGILSGTSPEDFALANQGQAKNMAVGAVNEFNIDLAQFGGAGDTLDALAMALTATSSQTSDYAAINLGQLKVLTQPFYDRLLSVGYTLSPLTTSGTYPWVDNGLSAKDFAVANLGQLKYLFSFDVTYSSTGSSLPDWWLIHHFGGLTIDGTAVNPNAFVPWSGGNLTYLQAFQQGLNPVDFYNGQIPTLNIVSGDAQTGGTGSFVSAPLVVSVTVSNGNIITGAPVIFSVSAGGGDLQASSTGTAATSIVALTDGDGNAQMFFQLPPTVSNTSRITVTSGTGSTAAAVTFTEFSDDGTRNYISPFAPSNVIGSVNADGSETITWQNNDDQSPIYIYLQTVPGTWTVTDTLNADTTSYDASTSMAGHLEIGNNYTPGGSTGSAGGSGGACNPGLLPFTPIQLQNYAAINISGSATTTTVSGTTTTAYVSNVALDDSNNVAFGFFYLGNQYAAYTWNNGSTTLAQNISFGTLFPTGFITVQAGDQFFVNPTLYFLTAIGACYGPINFGYTGSWDPSLYSFPPDPWVTNVQYSTGIPSALLPPEPPYYPSPSWAYPLVTTSLWLLDAEDYGYCGTAAGQVPDSAVTSGTEYNVGGIIVCSGTTLFDPLLASIGGAGEGTQVENANFTPAQMNINGWAYGLGESDWSPQAWNGARLVPLAPMSLPVSINNIGFFRFYNG
jgi:hypothetical protein